MISAEYTLRKLYEVFEKEFKKTFSQNAIIGLSGGIDSALVAGVAINSIGKDKVKLYYMPYKTSSELSLIHAKEFCVKFNIDLEIVNITEIADLFFQLNNVNDKLRKGNIMSRLRMVTLFDKAKEHNGIVIGTTNKTEMLLGYGTWYGDMASSINPIGSFYKKEIIALSKEIGIPESIINKKPSADLWQNQTDEDELGFTYALVDEFFYDTIENNSNKEFLINKYGKDFIEKVGKRVLNNSFKRNLPKICYCNDDNISFNEIDEIIRKVI